MTELGELFGRQSRVHERVGRPVPLVMSLGTARSVAAAVPVRMFGASQAGELLVVGPGTHQRAPDAR